MTEPETITIPLSRYKRLLDAELQLEALIGGGVDNWQGFDDAMEWYRENREHPNE